MLLKLIRQPTTTSTHCGQLFIDGKYFCDTIENTSREISPGFYPVRLTYSPHFDQVLPLLDNVIGRSGIRIHAGNVYSDSEGCILVGEYEKRNNRLIYSRVTLRELRDRLRTASHSREPIYIDIK